MSEQTILDFVDGRLTGEHLARVEAHARACLPCDDLLAAAFVTAAPIPQKTLAPGAKVGRYTALDLLGVGGMSEVYAAYDPTLDRKIALKLLRSGGLEPNIRDERRLLREAQATARLSHRNVVTVHDVGTFGARVFIAMEYVEGKTLTAWLAETPRSWSQIVAVFVDAARGLSAAHAARLVHRDFKPQNVMVGVDGVVRVMDFGLAMMLDGSYPDAVNRAASERAALGDRSSIQSNGQLAGTPTFMAPELFKGGVPDARSDQFSYCVALYQALYGEHPFLDSHGLSALPGAVIAGRLRPPPLRNAVPVWLRRVIVRGLSPTPEDRWPSIDDLVRALLANPNKVRRRRLRTVAATLALCATAAWVGRAIRQELWLCREDPHRLEDAWSLSDNPKEDHTRRAEVRSAFLATSAPTASHAWDRVSTLLDRYAHQWLAMKRDACEATHVRKEQSPEVLDLRMACLEDRHAALGALTRLLATADARVVENAVDAAGRLPSLDRCADVPMLLGEGAALLRADKRERAMKIHREADATQALFLVGAQQPALARAEALLSQARALGYAPLVAEMLLMIAHLQLDVGFDQQGSARLREAARMAISVRRDDIAAEAYEALAGVARPLFPWESLIWADVAETLLNRSGRQESRLRSWLVNDRARVLMFIGDYPEALRLMTEALAQKERILSPDDPDIARTLVSLGDLLHRMGRDEEALEYDARAMRSFVAAYGPDSTFVAMCLSNRGEHLLTLGQPATALGAFQDATSRWEHSLGADHAYLGFSLTGIGRALLLLDRPAEACPTLERALRIREAKERDPALTAETRFAMAQCSWATGDKGRALRLATAARDCCRADPTHMTETQAVEAWLARHATQPSRL